MILIGLGSNLTTNELKSSKEVLEAVIKVFPNYGISVVGCSRFYETEPVPKSDQPWYVNAVVQIETNLSALRLLENLHEIEKSFGRTRDVRWEARIVDLDLLAFNNEIIPDKEAWFKIADDVNNKEPIIPHPRMHDRDFVLIPLNDLNTDWSHPIFNETAGQLLKNNKSEGEVRIL